MSHELQPVRGVIKNYNERTTGGAHGQYKSIGPVKSLTFKLNREFLQNADDGAAGLNSFLASGVTVLSAKAIVHTPFSAAAAITFIGSNGQGSFPLGAGSLDEVGVTTISPTGNLAVGELTTNSTVFSTSPASVVAGTAEGEAEVYIEYVQTQLP